VKFKLYGYIDEMVLFVLLALAITILYYNIPKDRTYNISFRWLIFGIGVRILWKKQVK